MTPRVAAEMEPEQHLAQHGLETALARVAVTPVDTHEFTHLVSLAESLMWMYALFEWQRKRLGAASFFELCECDSGETLLGIIWARGKVQHSVADLGWITNGEARWVPLSLMAVNRGQPPDRHGRDAMYDSHVGGRPLMQPLRVAQRFLLALD